MNIESNKEKEKVEDFTKRNINIFSHEAKSVDGATDFHASDKSLDKKLQYERLDITIEFDDSLTAREKECIYWAMQGKTCGETAMILNLSMHTVKFYIEIIKKKLDCVTIVQVVYEAIRRGKLLIKHGNKEKDIV